MNNVYRLIWNHTLGALVPVSEISRARGKRGGRSVVAGAIALGGATLVGGTALGDGVTAANTATKVYNAPNGVPVVDIAKTNAAGLSHNQYTNYNVDTRGLVLNNNSPLTKVGPIQSQLAGRLESNQNLVQQAGVILNEVVEANRSNLKGYTEVVGGKADVVVANPWGVTCDGCGFINTDRALITTGTPTLGVNGVLTGFTVNGSDILVEGKGIDGSAQSVLDLVSRAIKIDGQVNGKDVGLTAGVNQYHYIERTATAGAAGASAPLYAIDSTALGGMYGNRIRLTATEAGVGVRMLGTAAASVDDFTLTSAGKVELASKISAERDLAIGYTGAAATGAIAVTGTDTELSAKRDLALSGALGGVTLQDAKLTAGQDLKVTAASLADSASAVATRFATRNLTATLTSAATINQTTWGAGSAAAWQAGSLAVGADGASLYAGSNPNAVAADRKLSLKSTSGNLDLAGAQLQATGNISLQSKQATNLGATGTVKGGDSIAVLAGTAVDNKGQVLAQNALAVDTAATSATLSNAGQLQAGTTLTLGSTGHELAITQTSTGSLLGDAITVTASSLNNSGVVQANKNITVKASGQLTNNASGKILNNTLPSLVDLAASGIGNAGTIQSAGGLKAVATNTLSNTGTVLTTTEGQTLTLQAKDVQNTATGIIQAVGPMSVTASNKLDNAGAVLMNAAHLMALKANAMDNSGKIESAGRVTVEVANKLTNTRTGTLLTKDGKNILINAGSLDNAGGMQSAGSLTANVRGAASNSGQLITQNDGGALSLLVASINNSGTIQSADKLEAVATTGVTNSGLVLATQSGKAATLRGTTLDNSGTAQSAGGLLVDFTSTVNNTSSGKLLADGVGDLVLRSAALNNVGAVQSKGTLAVTATGAVDNDGSIMATEAGKTLTVSGTSIDNSGTVQSADVLGVTVTGAVTNTGTLLSSASDKSVTLSGASLTNSGTVQGGGGLTAAVTGALSNQSTGKLLTTQSGGGVTLTAASLSNAGTAQSAGALSGTFTGAVDNTGTLLTLSTANGGNAGALTVSGGSTFDNRSTGKISSAGASTLSAGTIFTNEGTLVSTGAMGVTTGSKFDNKTGASVVGGGNISVASTASSFTLYNDGTVQSGGQLALGTSSGKAALTNEGTLRGDTLAIEAGDVTNNDSIFASKGGTLNASTLTNSSSTSKIIAATAQDNAGATTFTVSGGVTNNGAIHSNGDFTIKGASITNSNTAGFSSLAALNLEATGGSIGNNGALYSGGNMTLKAASGNSVLNNKGATINSDAKVTATADTFANYSEVVVKDLEINTTQSFYNGLSAEDLPTILLDTDNAVHSSASRIKFEEWYCNVAGSACNEFYLNERTTTVKEILSKPLPSIKPQLLASNGMTLNYGAGSATNAAGVLSALTMNITGTGTFTNQDFELKEHKSGQRWMDLKNNCTTCDITWYYLAPETESAYDTIPGAGGDTILPNLRGKQEEWGFVRAGGAEVFETGLSAIESRFEEVSLAAVTVALRTEGDNPDSKYSNRARDNSFKKDLGKTTISTSGAGVFAQTLNFTGGTLINRGSTSAKTPTKISGPNTVDPVTGQPVASVTGGTAAAAQQGSNAVSGFTGSATGATAATGLTFAGLNLSLPTNPNGFFVPSRNPNSAFLVEANPLFGVDSNFLGSSYFTERFGYNPETVTKRLGDANYEAYLIRQQLIDQTGNNLIAGGKTNEVDQMKALMDQALTQGKSLGLSVGKAPTASQLAALTQDIVWMEEVVVNGQTVLAPRVYLAASTRAKIVQGAVMVASVTNIDAKSVTNTGGTIGGSDKLTIVSKGDITNTSGSIKGGSVSVKSTEGSIVNQTATEGHGDSLSYKTTIGKTAGIEATKDLALDAKKDIKVIGADVKAKDGASLKAGGNITVDTIVDKTTTSTASKSGNVLRSNSSNTTVTSEKNIGSNLDIGGGLKLESGGNTTIAGSKVSADSLDVKAAGNFEVLARQDKVTTQSKESTSGIGVGGGLAGKETTTTNDFVGTNMGSKLDIKKNASIDAGGKMTLQGSDMNVGGNAKIKAKQGIEILDGLDERTTTSTTETVTVGKITGSSDSGSGSDSGSKKGSKSASAGASAEAQASSSTNVSVYETSTSTTNSGKKSSVASNLKVGGNLDATSEGTIKIQGSNIDAGGDVSLDGKNVEVLTGRNEEYSNTTTKTDSYGMFNDNEAKAQAGASAKAGTAGAKAGGKATAEANSTTTFGVRTTTDTESSYTLKNSSSSIKSGGNMKIKAAETATFVGANVDSGGDLDINAKDIINKAAKDITSTSSSKDTSTAGVYIGAEAEAHAEASANAGAGNARGKAGAGASAEASAGLRYATEGESEFEKSTTNVTNSFKAKGNITRKAENQILDQGTQLEAGGDINQSARVITEEAIHDTVESGSKSSSMDARVGVYAGAGADASADSSSGSADAGAEASAGLKASVAGGNSSKNSSAGTAVTSKYKAGGSIKSKSTEATTLVGTKFEAGKDVSLEGGTIDYKAAQDYKSESSGSTEYEGKVKVGIAGTAGVNAEGAYANADEGSKSTTAQAGSIKAGGGVKLKTTKGDLSLEGTSVDAAGAVNLDSAGNLDIKAARDTASSTSQDISAKAELNASAGGGGGKASGSYGKSKSESSTAQAASIKGGSVSATAAKDVNLEGTKIKSDGDTSIEAGGTVNLKAAKNTSSSTSFDVSADLGGQSEKSKDGGKKSSGAVGMSAEMGMENSVTSDAVSIESGGNLTVKGKKVVNQEADLKADGQKSTTGTVVNEKKENRSTSMEVGVGISGGGSEKTPAKGK